MDINNMVFAGRFNLLRYVAERASVFHPRRSLRAYAPENAFVPGREGSSPLIASWCDSPLGHRQER
jgi:hypothetical protein